MPLRFAEPARWQYIGPDGGWIHTLVPDRRDPRLWFAIVGEGNLYRSTDYGNGWKQVLQNVYRVAVNPVNSQVLTWNNQFLWISNDSGKTFTLSASGSQPYRIIFHPTDPGILFGVGIGTTGFGVSVDQGKHWTGFTNIPFSQDSKEFGFSDLLVSPLNPNVIYVSGDIYDYNTDEETPVLLVSSNLGRSWKVQEEKTYRFHYDPVVPDKAYAFADGVYLLSRSGWKKISDTFVYALTTVPRSPDELYATARYGMLLHSTNEGRTWSKGPDNLKGTIRELVAADDPYRTLLAASSAGVFRRNSHQGWNPSSTGLRELPIDQLFESAGSILVSSQDRLLFRHTPDAWQTQIFNADTYICVDPFDPLHYFRTLNAQTQFGFFLIVCHYARPSFRKRRCRRKLVGHHSGTG